jgi:hypothetical protein
LLRAAVCSTFDNALRPIEVLVSDHDFGEKSQEAIRTIQVPDGITVRHIQGPELRTQSANVNSLLQQATYERVILLHDDDLLTPGAVDRLAAAWDSNGGDVDAVYGRQYIASAEGVVDSALTSENDRYYHKTAPAGVQPSNLWAALVAQFPNDGMMMRRSLALHCGYPSETEVGRIPVDFHFGVRYAGVSTKSFLLLHDYVAIYRNSPDSVLRSKRKFYDGHLGYQHLERLSGLSALEEQGRSLALGRFAGSAVMGYLAAGDPARAASVLRRNLFHLDKNWLVRVALVMLVLLESLGVPALRQVGITSNQG